MTYRREEALSLIRASAAQGMLESLYEEWDGALAYKMLVEQSQDQGAWRANMRRIVRTYWDNAFVVNIADVWMDPYYQTFRDTSGPTLREGHDQAWIEGAAAVGFSPSEFTPEDRQKQFEVVVQQRVGFGRFIDFAARNTRITGAPLSRVYNRLDLWLNRWLDVKNQAILWFGADLKKIWVLGPTEHCRDCAGYAGKVYRGKVWAQYSIRPQHPCLACHGYNCQCQLLPTDKPITPGHPKAMTGC